MTDKIHIVQDTFENGNTHEQVPGVTIIIDGKFKQGLDILIAKSQTAKDYPSIIYEALTKGLEQMIRGSM